MYRMRGMLLLLVISMPLACIAESSMKAVSDRMNFGIAAGCSSTSLYMREIRVGDFTTSQYGRNPEVGYLFDVFTRINMNRFYIQTGLSYYNCSSSISFDVPENNGEGMSDMTFSISGQNLQVPALVGFYIIRQEPYSMSAYAGPELSVPLKGTYNSVYSGFGDTGTIDDLYPANWKMTFGLCFNISYVFLNFGYDFDLRSQSAGIVEPAVPMEGMPETVLKRTSSMLHFSVGLMF